jgi:radical SAM superfamily enzyme YgiQ (UPF0313 family)
VSIMQPVRPSWSSPKAATATAAATPRILLCSVFGPYAQDDEFGSRAINPMELYHNQVTRSQGPFSLRMFHRSWGMMLIQSNIDAPCTLLDFPTRDRFIEELTTRRYDVIGIGAIIPNVKKVQVMCELIREHQPHAKIVIGGHVANLPQLAQRIDADHIVRGEGVRWFRTFLGEDADRPLHHPRVLSGLSSRTMGMPLSQKPADVAATLIPSVGCPVGCNFCATSAMFGGKGKFINFYDSGDELFDVMCGLEADLKVRSFFVMDENFLLHRQRALRLLERMKQHDKSWALYVFSSARVLRSYTIEQLVGLGISWVWMGLEGKDSQYAKLSGIDTRQLVAELQSHGVRVLGSSIVGLAEHTPDNIDAAIDHAVSHASEFHQFMLYTPIPGTPLHAEHQAAGTLLPPAEVDDADVHGQLRFNFVHPHIPAGQETQMLLRAFQRDFDVNGPSVLRIARSLLAGWRRYRHHPDLRIRRRFDVHASELVTSFAPGLWAARKWFARSNPHVAASLAELLGQIHAEFGWRSRLVAAVGGPYAYLSLWREQRRLRLGHSFEPPTFYEHNHAAARLLAPALT